MTELPFAKLYTPSPYYGCPNCGARAYGAVNPQADSEESIYKCHGHRVGNLSLTGCGQLFKLPPEAYEESEGESEDD